MALWIRHYGLIIAIAGAVLFLNLGATRLWDRDEPRNAGCASEMLARNDWVTPYFNGELRSHKPVLLYWLMMSAYAVFGESEFAARFWSAVLGLGTVLCTYTIGRRLFNAEVGLWGAIVLATSLMFDVAARAATPDATLIFFSTAAITAWVVTTFPDRETEPIDGAEPQEPPPLHKLVEPDALFPASWWGAALVYSMLALAVLAKGPVGLLLPLAVMGLFLLIARLPEATAEPVSEAPATERKKKRRTRSADDEEEESAAETAEGASNPANAVLVAAWSGLAQMLQVVAPLHFLRTTWIMQPVVAALVVLAIAVPWYVWVGMRTEGEWLVGFFWEHNFRRATESFEGHSGSILYYPVAILCGYFPWSCFLVPVLLATWQRMQERGTWHYGYLLAAVWIGVYVGAFSLASTKLPSYVTPCYPGLALLTAAYLWHWIRNDEYAESWWPRISLGACAVVGVVLLIALPVVAARYLPGEEYLALLGLIPLLGAVIAFVWLEYNRMWETVVTYTVAATLFSIGLFGWGAVRADQHQRLEELVSVIGEHSQQPRLGAFGRLESSWIYYARRPIHETSDKQQIREFLAADRDGFIITTEEGLERLRSVLPPDTAVLAETRYFLHKGNLVLLGRPAERLATQRESGTR